MTAKLLDGPHDGLTITLEGFKTVPRDLEIRTQEHPQPSHYSLLNEKSQPTASAWYLWRILSPIPTPKS